MGQVYSMETKQCAWLLVALEQSACRRDEGWEELGVS
jgi:hypothetical protein